MESMDLCDRTFGIRHDEVSVTASKTNGKLTGSDGLAAAGVDNGNSLGLGGTGVGVGHAIPTAALCAVSALATWQQSQRLLGPIHETTHTRKMSS